MTVTTSGLAIGYRGVRIGSGIDMALAPGEIVMLLGPNGSGKSTLFKTVLGLIPRLGGAIAVDGVDINRLSRRLLARQIAYVPQAISGYFPFTVFDTVLMGRTAHTGPFAPPSAQDRQVVEGALGRLGLQDLSGRAFTQLSGGQRQLALIARALAQETPYIVMDEPTASLDFGNQLRVLDRVRELKHAGAGIIVASHDPDQALRIADRVLVMREGRLMADGPPAETLTPALLHATYGVDVAIADVMSQGRALGKTCFPMNG